MEKQQLDSHQVNDNFEITVRCNRAVFFDQHLGDREKRSRKTKEEEELVVILIGRRRHLGGVSVNTPARHYQAIPVFSVQQTNLASNTISPLDFFYSRE